MNELAINEIKRLEATIVGLKKQLLAEDENRRRMAWEIKDLSQQLRNVSVMDKENNIIGIDYNQLSVNNRQHIYELFDTIDFLKTEIQDLQQKVESLTPSKKFTEELNKMMDKIDEGAKRRKESMARLESTQINIIENDKEINELLDELSDK